MATVDFSSLTIPTPQPFDQTKPDRNREDACYILMQAMEILRDAGALFELPIAVNLSNVSIEVTFAGDAFGELVQAIKDLAYESLILDFGAFQLRIDGKTTTLET